MKANLYDILDDVEKKAQISLDGKVPYTLKDKVIDGQLYVDQGIIAGCAGGGFENICAAAWQIFLKQVRLLRLHSADHVLVQEIHLQTMRSASVIPPETSRIVKAPRSRMDRFLLLHLWMQDLSQQQQQTKVS